MESEGVYYVQEDAFRSLSFILHLLPPGKENLNCDQVCLCSSRFIWESQPENTRASRSFSLLLFSPGQPHVSPPLSSSPLDQTIHFSWHMESVQSSLLLLVWLQSAVASLSLSLSLSHNPLLMSPPVVFWVRGSIPQHCSHHYSSTVCHCAEAHSSCNSGTYSVYAVLLLRELKSGSDQIHILYLI